MPCLRCGAAMRPEDATDEHVRCDFCGARDRLPADAAARLAALRRRLADVRAARQAFEGVDRSIVAGLEGGWLTGTLKAALGPLSLILLLVVAPALFVDGASPEGRVTGLGLGLGLAVQLASVVGGMALAFLMVARRYRRVVRPRILARVPAAPGSPARCRACGGPVTADRQAFVDCPYCGATNLLTDELTRERDRLLAEELAAYRRRADQADHLAREHVRLVSAGIFLGNLGGMLLGVAFGGSLGHLLARLLLG